MSRMSWTLLCATVVVVLASSSRCQDHDPSHHNDNPHDPHNPPTTDSHGCDSHKTAALKQRWKYLLAQKTASEKLYLYQSVLSDIAKTSRYLAALLRSTYLTQAHHSKTKAAEMFFMCWDYIIITYPDEDKLKHQIYYDAATRAELARGFYGNAPLIARSLLAVFGETLLTVSDKLAWSACLNAIAEKVQYIAGNVKVEAICHVDADTGIPGFPIFGNVVFTQLLYGGETTIRVSLCGFNDTMNHGWHVHAVGSTDNYCLAAGPHFNPRNQQHGAPTDINRHVGDLGNFKADYKGKVFLKFQDKKCRFRAPITSSAEPSLYTGTKTTWEEVEILPVCSMVTPAHALHAASSTPVSLPINERSLAAVRMNPIIYRIAATTRIY